MLAGVEAGGSRLESPPPSLCSRTMSTPDSSPRLFPLQGHGDEFHTGICPDGSQVLMGLLAPYVVAYFFDSRGALTGARRQPWRQPAPRIGHDGPFRLQDPSFKRALAQQLQDWKAELGFRPAPLQVRAFQDEELGVGIEELPELYRDLSEADPEEHEELERERDEWLRDGMFVFWWAKDYHLSREGEVLSS